MNDAESFKLVNHWFNQLVDESVSDRQNKLKTLAASGELTDKQLSLLKQMLLADEGTQLPEILVEVDDEWQVGNVQEQIESLPNIGSYKLLELIGSGGMGHVYLAARDDGSYEQKVAIKLSQFHLNKNLVKRFENERQILAQLTHPNIAQLLDGGTAANDQPYLVMEHVKGLSIDAYCIEHQLDLRERLELIIQTCAAVSFAHQKLVLHRDLKPANILVNELCQVKLLDFGIAKLLADDVEQQQQTMTQVMTRHYASPEQIKGEMVSTQSDLFSLAIITYELVSGYHPFNRNSEIERDQNVVSGKIKPITSRNDDPNAIYPELTSIGAEKLKGDLENILQKALAPQASERYASIDAFAQDLKNILSNRPVMARKPTLVYAFKKMVQRNLLTSMVVLLSFIALLAASVYSLNQAKMAQQQAAIAQVESKNAQAVAAFMSQLFAEANPQTNGKDLSAKEVLNQGFVNLDLNDDIEPQIKYELYSTIYQSMWNLGQFDETGKNIERHYAECVTALGKFNASCQKLLIGQFEIHQNNNDNKAIMEVLNKAEQISLSNPNKNITELLYIYDMKSITLNSLEDTDQSIKYAKESLELRKEFEADDPYAIRISMNNLALSYILSDQFTEASAIIEEMPLWINKIDSKINQAKSRSSLNNLQAFYHATLKNDVLSVKFREQAVAINKQNFETLSRQMIWVNRVLADAYFRSGQIEQSLKSYNEVEQLYLNQVTDNDAAIYRITLDRVLIYLFTGNQAAITEMQKLIALNFDRLSSKVLRTKTALVYALFELEYGNESYADEAVEKARLIISQEYNDSDSIYVSYFKLIEAMQLFNANQTDAALKYANELAAYWVEFPKSHLGFKLAVDRFQDHLKKQ